MFRVERCIGLRLWLLGCVSALPILTAGCQDQGSVTLSPVKGVVTKGGKPVPRVSVTFTQTEKNFSATGVTNENGEFILIAQNGKAGAMPGKNKVTLTAQVTAGPAVVDMSNPSTAEQFMKQREASVPSGKSAAPKTDESNLDIPAEYRDPSKTPLSYEVTAGENSFDIPLP
jgi:hypothetical protein